MAKINVGDYSQDDVDRALELLEKDTERKAKLAKKRAEMTPEEKEAQKARLARARTRNKIMIRKAQEAGITVSDAEIDAEL